MEKKHDLLFCPQCGVKLEGDEIICAICGFRLVDIAQTAATQPPPVAATPVEATPPPIIPTPIETPAPPPIEEPPVSAPIPQAPPPQAHAPVVNQPVYQQPTQTYNQPKVKKGMGALGWILIVLLIVIVGCGAVAGLHYAKVINVTFLENIIPQKEDASQQTTTADPTRYYVVHSFAVVGSKWQAIVSDIVVSRKPHNNEEGAKNQFKKAIKDRYPDIYSSFYNNIISNQYMTLPQAQGARSSLLKSYDNKKYDIKTVNFNY